MRIIHLMFSFRIMATSIDSHRHCAICLEDMTLRTPRALSCLHSFCSVCLEHLALKPASILVCPVCRKETKLQRAGIKALPENFYLKNEDPSKGKKHCDECIVNQKKCTLAYLKCHDCNINLCKNCSDQHIERRIFAFHRVLKLETECPLHNKKVTLFCTKCTVGMCALCVVKHTTHEECVTDINLGISEKVLEIQVQIQSKLAKNEEQKQKTKRLELAIESVRKAMKEHLIKKKEELDHYYSVLLEGLGQHFGTSYKHSINLIEKEERNILSLSSSLDEVTGKDKLDLLCKIAEKVGAELCDVPIESNSTIPEFRPNHDQGNIKQFGQLVKVPNTRQKDDPRFQVFVETEKKHSFTMFTEPFEKIGKLKSKISTKTGIPMNQVKLYTLAGKELHRQNLTLADYGIQNENTLRLTYNLQSKPE